jgi:hypothetical protein
MKETHGEFKNFKTEKEQRHEKRLERQKLLTAEDDGYDADNGRPNLHRRASSSEPNLGIVPFDDRLSPRFTDESPGGPRRYFTGEPRAPRYVDDDSYQLPHPPMEYGHDGYGRR